MSAISFTTITDGTTIDAADVNTPLNTIYTDYNGNIDSSNLASSAVTTAKITNSAVDYTKVAAGMVVQVVYTTSTAVATGTTQLPTDDTIPQNTEGDEYMTLAITPKATSHILVIEVSALLTSATAGRQISGAIFQDSTANALAADSLRIVTDTGGMQTLNMKHIMAAGTTSSTTFKFRAGPNAAATVTFNGTAGGRQFGAITKSSMIIYEYKA